MPPAAGVAGRLSARAHGDRLECNPAHESESMAFRIVSNTRHKNGLQVMLKSLLAMKMIWGSNNWKLSLFNSNTQLKFVIFVSVTETL